MSRVKLIVQKRSGLAYGDVINTDVKLPEDTKIYGVCRTEFEPDKDGYFQSSDDLCIVIDTDDVNNLVGRMLTLVEASTSNKEQQDALKDLAKQACWNWWEGRMDGITRTWRKDKGYETDIAVEQ